MASDTMWFEGSAGVRKWLIDGKMDNALAIKIYIDALKRRDLVAAREAEIEGRLKEMGLHVPPPRRMYMWFDDNSHDHDDLRNIVTNYSQMTSMTMEDALDKVAQVLKVRLARSSILMAKLAEFGIDNFEAFEIFLKNSRLGAIGYHWKNALARCLRNHVENWKRFEVQGDWTVALSVVHGCFLWYLHLVLAPRVVQELEKERQQPLADWMYEAELVNTFVSAMESSWLSARNDLVLPGTPSRLERLFELSTCNLETDVGPALELMRANVLVLEQRRREQELVLSRYCGVPALQPHLRLITSWKKSYVPPRSSFSLDALRSATNRARLDQHSKFAFLVDVMDLAGEDFSTLDPFIADVTKVELWSTAYRSIHGSASFVLSGVNEVPPAAEGSVAEFAFQGDSSEDACPWYNFELSKPTVMRLIDSPPTYQSFDFELAPAFENAPFPDDLGIPFRVDFLCDRHFTREHGVLPPTTREYPSDVGEGPSSSDDQAARDTRVFYSDSSDFDDSSSMDIRGLYALGINLGWLHRLGY